MYAVTGASGQLGRLVIEGLLARVTPGEIVALVRDPAKADDLAGKGIDVRRFDYEHPEYLAAALEGVQRLLFISSDDVSKRTGQHRAVVEAAAAVRPQLIVYTSVIHADDNPISVSPSHRETERLIRESGLAYAFLRNSWYIENYLIGASAAIERGALFGSSGDGRISAASRADYAAAAVEVLTSAPAQSGIFELAGDQSFALADVAAALSEASGKPVSYHHLSEEAYRDALAGAGLPAERAAALAEYSARSSDGILADDGRKLSALIGRPTETLREVALRTLS